MHENSGECSRCQDIINKYPRFNPYLRAWFEGLQKEHPELHTSCAGRGKQAQEEAFKKKASKAKWRQSAHNFNAALDLFLLIDDQAVWDTEKLSSVISPMLPDHGWIEWYGKPGSPFFEAGHVELSEWKVLVERGILYSVEA